MERLKVRVKLNKVVSVIDGMHLELLGLLVVFIILLPIVILKTGAIFPIADQLDETILNYVFPARFPGSKVYENIMCGYVSTEGLKPFAPLFVPLYMIFDTFIAFVLQYLTVVTTGFFGTYFCVKKMTGSSISAFLSASVFSLLPFRSVYGNLLSGIPLLIYLLITIYENTQLDRLRIRFICYLGLVYYSASTSLVLIGYGVLLALGFFFVIDSIHEKKINKGLFASGIVMTLTYLLFNLDIVIQVLGVGDVQSHREEFVIRGTNFFAALKNYLFSGVALNESFHKYIYIPVLMAIPFLFPLWKKEKKLVKTYLIMCVSIFLIALVSAALGSETLGRVRNDMTGMIRSFQFDRFYLILPGLWYILLGVSLSVIVKGMCDNAMFVGWILGIASFIPTLLFVAKNPDCIFYQNVNQVNNGSITGYISWEALYSEELMAEIEKDIAMPMNEYRVASIGICPVVSLMHGFYTIDGYSNNYALDYKHKMYDIQCRELEMNPFAKDYFASWGNRCYLFYHEWGNAYLIGKEVDPVINEFCFDSEGLKKLNCRYIFSAGEIRNPEEYGLCHFGTYENDSSFWRIWVYELQ